jgi:hypothetical protein
MRFRGVGWQDQGVSEPFRDDFDGAALDTGAVGYVIGP